MGLPWPSLLAFVRLVSDPRVYQRPLTVRDAWERVTAWLARPSAWVPVPGSRHASILGGLLVQEEASRLVPDAHLAALAIEHGLKLCSADRDFARFQGLVWENPIAES